MDELIRSRASKFLEEGFLAPLPLFSPGEIKKAIADFEHLERKVQDKREDYENLHFYIPWARQLATHPDLLDLVESIIGPEVIISGSLVLNKWPSHYSHLSWHQDQYFFHGTDTTPYLSAWIALTESTVENGCMKVILGSHKKGIIPHMPFYKDEKNLLKQGEEIKISPGKGEVRDIILKPGELSLHHGSLIHCSLPNQSQYKRTGFIVRFVTPQLAYAPKPVLYVRGKKKPDHLPIFEQTPFMSIEEGVAAYEKGSFEIKT